MKIEEWLATPARLAYMTPDGANELVNDASGIMHLVRDLVRCSAFLLSSWDPIEKGHRHHTLAAEGYLDSTISHVNDEYVHDNPAFRIAHTDFRALRWRDYERDWKIQFKETLTAQKFLIPSGFHEGTTMCLRLPSGRYTGAVHMSWASAAAPTDARRETVERFRPMLAAACDLLRAPQILARILAPNAFALLMTATGVVHDLPGRATGPHLGEGGGLRRFLLKTARCRMPPRFLWPDDFGSCHKVTLTDCREDLVLIMEEAAPWPFGLSLREIQVLTLIAGGAPNPEIAQRLFISTRTVSTHVEHILAKTGCPNRAKLAAVAAAEGLLLCAAAAPVDGR